MRFQTHDCRNSQEQKHVIVSHTASVKDPSIADVWQPKTRKAGFKKGHGIEKNSFTSILPQVRDAPHPYIMDHPYIMESINSKALTLYYRERDALKEAHACGYLTIRFPSTSPVKRMIQGNARVRDLNVRHALEFGKGNGVWQNA